MPEGIAEHDPGLVQRTEFIATDADSLQQFVRCRPQRGCGTVADEWLAAEPERCPHEGRRTAVGQHTGLKGLVHCQLRVADQVRVAAHDSRENSPGFQVRNPLRPAPAAELLPQQTAKLRGVAAAGCPVGETRIGEPLRLAEEIAECQPVPLPVRRHVKRPVRRLVNAGRGVARGVAILVGQSAIDTELSDGGGLHVDGGVKQVDFD